jgi:hypothetical protein
MRYLPGIYTKAMTMSFMAEHVKLRLGHTQEVLRNFMNFMNFMNFIG